MAPIDTSIYGNIKQFEMPSYADSQQKAMNLSSLAMRNTQAMKEMQQGDQDRAFALQQRNQSLIGNAMHSLAGLDENERASVYPKVRAQLIQIGALKPEEAPEVYERGFFRSAYAPFAASKEGQDRQKTDAEIGLIRAQTHKALREKPAADPMASWMAKEEQKRAFEKADKENELKRYTNMGDWSLTEGATPTLDDAKKFKAGASAARALLSNLNEYQALLGKRGAEIAGKDAQRLESLNRDIQLAAKNEDLYGLGVLTGPDLALLEEIVGKAPTGVGDFLNPWAGSKAQNKAQQFREMVNTRLGAKAKTYGFQPSKEWQSLAMGGAKKAPKEDGGFGTTQAYAGGGVEAPKHGTVEDGFVFMGGDPSKPENWKKKER